MRRWYPVAVAFLLTVTGLAAAAAPARKDGKTPANASARLEATALAQRIDQAIGQRLASDKVKPSPLADDAEFLRRAYLDLTGVIPSADKTAEFLDSKDPNKRAKLIDELLASPTYGRHMADIWQNLLIPRNSDNRRITLPPFTRWLEENFNSNKPWDKFATDLITAEGPQDKNGAVTFFLANPTPDKVTDTICRVFLGNQLQCAQCHNHPFTGWKQNEYWGMAGFFFKVRQSGNPRQANQTGAVLAISETGTGRGNRLPESAKVVPPKFLQGEQAKLDSSAPYRPVLARWMTSAGNPFFARSMVNRTWAQLFGRGFCNPIDDLHENNTPSHPELFQELADQFAVSGFDLKHLIRAICSSQTYQRTSKPAEGNDSDTTLFSHMGIKVLSPEQLFDSLEAVVGKADRARGARPAAGRGPASPREQFVAFFSTDDGADPTEYQSGIPQALRLMNSAQINSNQALLAQAVKSGKAPDKVIEFLYLGAIARRPTAAESQRLVEYVGKQGAGREAYGDVLWALMNSSEFTLNR